MVGAARPGDRPLIVVSLASGTSGDGLDVGVVDLHLDADGVIDAHIVSTWTAGRPAT